MHAQHSTVTYAVLYENLLSWSDGTAQRATSMGDNGYFQKWDDANIAKTRMTQTRSSDEAPLADEKLQAERPQP